MKEIIITSSVLILCIMLIRVLFKGKIGSRLQYALWLLVVLRLVVPTSAQISLAVGSLEKFRVMDVVERAEERWGSAEEQLEQPISFAIGLNNGLSRLAARFVLGEELQGLSADGPSSVFLAGRSAFSWLDIARGIWRGGMAVVAAWIVVTNLIFWRRLRRSRKEFVLPDEAEWRNKRVRIYTVEQLASPCLYGLPGREAIYLTPDVAGDQEKLRHVLTHELCHRRQGDSVWAIVRAALLVVYWMNPLVWAAAVLSKRDCELACDERALLLLGEEERIAYGETLLSIITRKSRAADIACTATTMTGSVRSIKERIRFIAGSQKAVGTAVAAVLALILVAVMLVFTRSPKEVFLPDEGITAIRMPERGLQERESAAGQADALSVSQRLHEEMIAALAENRTRYLGDATRTSQLAGALLNPTGLAYKGVTLHTLQTEPESELELEIDYELTEKGMENIDSRMVFLNAVMLFATIENVEKCSFAVEDGAATISYERAELEAEFGALWSEEADKADAYGDWLEDLYVRVGEYFEADR